MDKEKCGGWCRLSLKRVVNVLVSQVQWGGGGVGEGLVRDGQNQV
jgi:hypothetical protein